MLCVAFLLILQHKNPTISTAKANIKANTPNTIVLVFWELPLVVSWGTILLVAVISVTIAGKVVLVVGGTGAHVLSNRMLQYWPVALNPCLIHSGCGSSFLSKQQYEHCWQLWETSAKKYPLAHVLLQLVSDTLVQLADTISWGAHCWQFLQEDESSSAENVPKGHFLQDMSDTFSCVSFVPHRGYNPLPGWHVAQVKQSAELPFENTMVYLSPEQKLQ